MTPAIDPIAVALLVARHLEAIGVAYTTGGSIASSFAGEPRSTLDIDMVVALQDLHVDALAASLASESTWTRSRFRADANQQQHHP